MDNLNKMLDPILSLIPKKQRKLVTNENIIAVLYFIVAIYIYQKKPKALIGFLVHPFSQVLLVGTVVYYLSNKNYNIAIGLSFIFVTSILINKETQVDNIGSLPIENREHFSDKKEEDISEESETEAEEEFEDDEDEDDEEEFDSDDDEEEENFTVGKKKNLNDTFKNLHDAIHQLETFITTPN